MPDPNSDVTESPMPAKKAVPKKVQRAAMKPSINKADKLWNYLSKCCDKGYVVLVRDRSGQNTIVDIHNP